ENAAALLAALETACAAVAPAQAPISAPTSTTAAPAPAREKRNVGMVFFRANLDAPSAQALIGGFAGSLARADGSFAAVFDHDAGDNPARRALLAANAIVERGIAERVVVDSGPVTVMPRPDGGRRYGSAVFAPGDRFARADDPVGVIATERTVEMLTGHARRPTPSGRFLLVAEAAAAEARAGAAELVGRDPELEALIAAAARAPAIVTVTGEGGVGKSHFLVAAAERLRAPFLGREVLSLRARSAGGGFG